MLLEGDQRLDQPTPQDLLRLRSLAAAITRTGPDGVFTFENVEPGTYTLVAAVVQGQPTDAASLLRNVRYTASLLEVPEGKEYAVDLSL